MRYDQSLIAQWLEDPYKYCQFYKWNSAFCPQHVLVFCIIVTTNNFYVFFKK